jgi:glutamate synthase (NADPH) large chain
VLGKTGRNFGAGMSGGSAYVYDPTARFPGLVNRDMVDLDPLTAEDIAFLHTTITRHHHETNSALAKMLLDDWAAQQVDFVKVMPQDFKRVLRAKAAAEAEGRNVDDAIMAAARA